MKLNRLIVALLVALAALTHRSDGQQAQSIERQLRLASLMPGQALLYLQAQDLSALMRTWLASSVRTQFYKSPSFNAFSRSRIYLRLQDRKKEFETALGFGLDENRLTELAGGLSAIAVYDIGKLEIVFATEVRREKAIATALFKNVAQFQERSSEGSPYYVREVTTDGGRLNQQFCFAYPDGKLIVTTTEGLMIRSLRNLRENGSESLIGPVTSLANLATGFSTHQVTMWLDQTRLNQNRHFAANWIHGTPSGSARASLGDLEAGLVDLRITREGLIENRWFKTSRTPASTALNAADSTALLRFVPPEAQSIQLHSPDSTLSGALSLALAGRHLDSFPLPPIIPDRTRSSGSSDMGDNVERYGRLDARFDRDVDDEIGGTQPKSSSSRSARSFEETLSAIVGPTSPVGYMELARSRIETGKPFVRFDRAVVVGMQTESSLDRSVLEQSVSNELRTRFVVRGADIDLEWRDGENHRYVAQSLVEQGAAYAISGKNLIVSSSREFLNDILRAARGPATGSVRLDESVNFHAIVRVTDARPVFDLLMLKLDGPSNSIVTDGSEAAEVKFFSGNLSSLIAASAFREMRLSSEKREDFLLERVVYSW
jgi:hypothetical protein